MSGDLSDAAVAQLRRGVRLEEGLARAERVEVLTRSRTASRLRMVLRTGWKRQIRRMCAAVDLRVERLVRIRMGSLRLGRLRPGEWRELTKAEIADLARPSTPASVAAPKPSSRAASRSLGRERDSQRDRRSTADVRAEARRSAATARSRGSAR